MTAVLVVVDLVGLALVLGLLYRIRGAQRVTNDWLHAIQRELRLMRPSSQELQEDFAEMMNSFPGSNPHEEHVRLDMPGDPDQLPKRMPWD